MAPLYGWKQSASSANSNTVIISSEGDVFAEDINSRLKKAFLATLCRRPTVGLTEVRRDGKDNMAVARVIRKEFLHRMDIMEQSDFINHMHTYAAACWAMLESPHQQFLDDEQPENERARLDPDHWYEINLTNATLFSNLYLEAVEGLEQLVPGRLFSTGTRSTSPMPPCSATCIWRPSRDWSSLSQADFSPLVRDQPHQCHLVQQPVSGGRRGIGAAC